MNTIKKLLSVFALILCLCVMFAACSDNTPDGDDDTDGGSEQENDGGNNENNENNNDNSDGTSGDNTDNSDGTGNTSDPDDGKITYTVTVKDMSGNPVSGISVQLCNDETCRIPVKTNENGVAEIKCEESNYHITILSDEYAVDSDGEIYFPEGSVSCEISVVKLPTGTKDDPIPVQEAKTTVKLEAGEKLYYTVSLPEGKVLTIKNANAVVEYNETTYKASENNGTIEILLGEGDTAEILVYVETGKADAFYMNIEANG